ncbi:MAG: type II toxin-antitoxin system RelE/ParE family toxin [Mucilaginibacter sp.]
MSFKVLNTERFARELKRLVKKYPSLKSEFIALVSALEKDPVLGVSIGNGFYKIRIKIASKGKGKSGGARVITYLKIIDKTVTLATIYDKSEKEDIPDKELNLILQSLLK